MGPAKSKVLAIWCACGALFLPTVPAVTADSNYWKCDPAIVGDWRDGNNWTLGVPTSSHVCIISNGGTVALGSGQVRCSFLSLGYTGAGTMVQSGQSEVVADNFYAGSARGSNGVYELQEGVFRPTQCSVGGEGTGVFRQTGGTCSPGYLMIGIWESGDGTYEFVSGKITCNISVGYAGRGTFIQSGGQAIVPSSVEVGHLQTSVGTYELTGTGYLQAPSLYIGIDRGQGTFIQNGGECKLGTLYCGQTTSKGRYEMNTGTLSADVANVGYHWLGTFAQTGGTVTVSGNFNVGLAGTGRVEVRGGNLSAGSMKLGAYCDSSGSRTGIVEHTGGTVTVGGLLQIGYYSSSTGTYTIGGSARLIGGSVRVGYVGTGTLTQNDGEVSAQLVAMGYDNTGTYYLNGGSLHVGKLHIGGQESAHSAAGSLHITNPGADIVVSEELFFGVRGALSACPQASIHMTGSAFTIKGTDESALAGLAALTLVFEGGPADVDPFEVAGKDLGTDLGGLNGNFSLGTLRLGGAAGIGKVRMVNNYDNQSTWTGAEALYVHTLEIGDGCYLDLNGLNLYYYTASIHKGAIIVGGTPTPVPEPTSLCLLVCTCAALLRRGRVPLRHCRT